MVKRNQKGQVKIQQTAFMIIALTLFFVLVGLFVLSFSLSGLKQSKSNLDNEKAVLLVSNLADFPEFSCGSAFGTQKISCVDFDKVFSLKLYAENYKEFFDVEGIKIVKVFPSSDVECTGETYPDCGVLSLFDYGESGVYTGTFVTLCRKAHSGDLVYNKCEIAKLMVKFK